MENKDITLIYIDSFEEKNNKFIVTEFCNSNLRKELMKKKNGYCIDEIKEILYLINEGIKYLLNIVNCIHIDLKPYNILINKITKNDKTYYIYKLCDYGGTKDINNTYFSSIVGTPKYISNEVLNGKYSKKLDIFVLGLILYELYYGNKVSNFDEKEKLNNIKNEFNIKDENEDKKEFKKLKDLIEKCIKDEKDRIDWEDYFNHPFFNNENETKLNKNITKYNFEKLIKEIKEASNLNPKVIIKPVINGIKLSPAMFDERGNKSSGWSVGEKRGGRDYIPPTKGYVGYGLNVWGKYDKGNNDWLSKDNNPNEWYVAYHATNFQYLKSILENKLQPGKSQFFANDDDLNHPGQIVGKGVYCVSDFNEAEIYSTSFNSYNCIIMCRINPKTVRIPKSYPKYLVVNGSDNDIRPYRILIKKN